MPPLQHDGPSEPVPVVLRVELGDVSEMRAGGLTPVKGKAETCGAEQVHSQAGKGPAGWFKEVAAARRGLARSLLLSGTTGVGERGGMPPPFKPSIPGSLPLNTLPHSQPVPVLPPGFQVPSCPTGAPSTAGRLPSGSPAAECLRALFSRGKERLESCFLQIAGDLVSVDVFSTSGMNSNCQFPKPHARVVL